jgi:hypothetical protein
MKAYSISDLFFTEWDHLTAKNHFALIELSDHLLQVEPGSEEHGLLIISILRSIRKNKNLVGQLNVEQAVDCFNDIAFFRRNDDGSFRHPWYSFPIGSFKISGEQFNAPLPNALPLFYNSFQQLVYADSSFSAFCLLNHKFRSAAPSEKKDIEQQAESAICSLIAVLYTKPEDFNLKMMSHRAALIPRKLNVSQRSLILNTYANIRMFITDRCPNLFPKPLPSEEDKTFEPPSFTGPMWMDLRYDLATTDVFKGFETANEALIYHALDYLEKKAIAARNPKPKSNGEAQPG